MFDEGSKVVLGIAAATALKLVLTRLTSESRKKRYEKVGHVTELICYPIKSCQGLYAQEAECAKLGLKFNGVKDRHWMVVRPNGRFMSQRQNGKMALIEVQIKGDTLQISAPNMPTLQLPIKGSGTPEKIWVHDARVDGVDCGEESARWMSQFLGAEGYRLLQFTDDCSKRHFIEQKKEWETSTLYDDLSGFADWGSYLFLTESSLEELNKHLPRPVTMKNFRPNIVIGGSTAFDEDNWEEIRIGESVNMRCLDACTRCVMTTVDPEKGERSNDGEPLATLRRIRTIPPYDKTNDCAFGVNTAPDTCGTVRVGDPVYAIRRK